MTEVKTKIKKVWNKLQLEAEDKKLRTFLTFRLASELFAINVDQVTEILEVPSMTKVPNSPEELIGVFNLRGTVLPIVDARVKFSVDNVDHTVNTCVLVIEVVIDNEKVTLGLLVDGVEEVLEIAESEIRTAKNVASRYLAEIFEGTVKFKDNFINILKLDQVINRTSLVVED